MRWRAGHGHRAYGVTFRAVSGPAANPPTVDNRIVRAVFRLPRSAYLPVLFLALGVSVLVSSWWWTLVYLVPLLAAVFVARRATLVDRDRIVVRAILGSVQIPWSGVRGLLIGERGRVSVALDDQTAVRLPYVRVRHLPVLSQVSGNRVPAIPAAQAGPAPATPAARPEPASASDTVETDPVETDGDAVPAPAGSESQTDQ